jgi:thiosulfate reductase cytochrome b subunit
MASRGLGTGAGLFARIVHLVVAIVVLIIVAGILLVVLKANPTNGIGS